MGVQKIKQEHQHLYINITSEGEPQIKYCLKMLDTLEFEMWCNNKKVNYCAVKDSIVPANQFYLTSCLMVWYILQYLRYKSEHFSIDKKTDEEIIHEVVDKLNDSRFSDKKKIGFLTEQLSPVFPPPNGRRYSSSLLAMSVMWQQISPAAYHQIASEDILTLRMQRHLRKLTSAVDVNLEITGSTIAYLQARKSKLFPKDLFSYLQLKIYFRTLMKAKRLNLSYV